MKIDATDMHYRELNARIREAAAAGERSFVLGGVAGQRYIGAGLGADVAIDPADTDVPEELATFSRDVGRSCLPGVDYVIETSGSAPARRQIIPSLRRGGRAAIVGVGSNEEVINPSHIHGKACTLIGSVVFPLGWLWDLAAFLAASRASFEPAVTHRFGLDDAVDALRTADEALGGKVVFEPHQDLTDV